MMDEGQEASLVDLLQPSTRSAERPLNSI